MNLYKRHLILLFFIIIRTLPGQFQVLNAQSAVAGVDPSYSSSKNFITTSKSRIRIDRISEDSLSILFTSLLTEKIIPYWLGTPWSFEGHTSIPRQGEIACGYFVSTTLRDAGFNLNRYKFAQQLPVNEGKTLSLGKPLIEIHSTSTAERIEALQDTLSEGIYFIGFDRSHVGYIHRKGDELFIIHSNYIGARGVEIERIEESDVFSYYHRICIAEISTNRELLKKWLHNEAVIVVNQ
jgi:hypothetical protein